MHEPRGLELLVGIVRKIPNTIGIERTKIFGFEDILFDKSSLFKIFPEYVVLLEQFAKIKKIHI